MKGVRAVLVGFWSLVVGLGVTIRHFFRTTLGRKPVTEVYPHKEPELPPAFRSAIKLIRFDETNSHDCVGCKACERICPSFCISVDGDKVDGIRKKRATHFEMDFALCSLCGLCIDACPTATLEYSRIYDDVGYTRNWKHDLLAPFNDYEAQFVEEQRDREEKEAAEKARLAAEKKAQAAAAKAAKEKAAADKAPAADAGNGSDPAADAAALEKQKKIEAAKAAKAARLAAKAAEGDGNGSGAGNDGAKASAAKDAAPAMATEES
ncbi:MAG: NADH-quinone oxidoreductase subunit I [Deltaproteobacteria bacterium]|nr:MAG: NADH-quinone oxidoreductase subunit I [Deltaproteobacteria bacterium]